MKKIIINWLTPIVLEVMRDERRYQDAITPSVPKQCKPTTTINISSLVKAIIVIGDVDNESTDKITKAVLSALNQALNNEKTTYSQKGCSGSSRV